MTTFIHWRDGSLRQGVRLPQRPKKKYSVDQPRDWHGRFGETGGEGRIPPVLGVGARGSIAGDLEMQTFPPEIQAKIGKSFARSGVTPEQARGNFVDVYEASSPAIRSEFRNWYEDAKQFNGTMAEKYGVDRQVATGITAANSPGGRWEANQATTEIVLRTWDERDHVFTQEEADKINATLEKPDTRGGRQNADSITDYRIEPGQTFDEVMHDDARAGAVAIGRMNGLQLRSYDNLTKSVEILTAKDQVAAVNDVLSGPKVRSFYNNMLEPKGTDDVCIDKHMMRSMVNGIEDSHESFDRWRHLENDSTITSSPKYRNASVGAYPLMADTLREATAAVNAVHAGEDGYPLRPNEFQAIVWGQQINQYSLTEVRQINSGEDV